jgi:hypothetical protein
MASFQQALRLITQSNIVAQGAAAASMTVLKASFPWAIKIKGTISGGTANTGTITVTGTVGGVAGISETLTYTQAMWSLGNKLFTAISGIMTSGLADEATKPTILIEACDGSGNPKYWSEVGTSFYACSCKPVRMGGGAAYRFMANGVTANQLYQVSSDELIPITIDSRFTIDDLNDSDGLPLTLQPWSLVDPLIVSGGLTKGYQFLAVRSTA